MISIRVDARQALSDLRLLQFKQIPFALAGALTSTAFDVRRQIVERTYPRSFTVRARGFPRAAFRVQKATKRRLEAAVFDRFKLDWLAIQAEGGIKRPRASTAFAVPIDVQRTASGKIPRRQAPRALPRAFRADLRRGYGPAIWQRPAKAGGRLRLVYAIEPDVTIRKRFRFYEDGRRVAERQFPRQMRRAWARALATARR